jgi:hypothetical protein
MTLNSGNASCLSVQIRFSSCFLSQHTTVSTCKATMLPLVLCGCETWSDALGEERSLLVFETSVLRITRGRKVKDVTVGWRRLAKDVTVGWRRLAKDVTVVWRRLAKDVKVGWRRLAKDVTVGWRRLAKDVTVVWRRLAKDVTVGWRRLGSDVYTSHTYCIYSLRNFSTPLSLPSP